MEFSFVVVPTMRLTVFVKFKKIKMNQMKTIKVLSIVGLLAFNMALLSKRTSATEAGVSGKVDGVATTLNGIVFCCCPDKTANCQCYTPEN